jgi:homoserine kinase
MREVAYGFAPGSIGNVGAGLDILGLAVAGAGDETTIRLADAPGIEVIDPGHPDLPSEAERNSAALAAAAVFRKVGISPRVTIAVRKGLPLSGGQGGSAASAVAGAVAANHLTVGGLDAAALLECALAGEAVVSGRHADNLAPSLLGGLVLVRSLDPLDFVALPVPSSLSVVLVHPAMQMQTRTARALLPTTVSRELAIAQAANVAAMVAGACLGDLRLLGRGVSDWIAEPARAPLLPGFLAAKQAALDAGALGSSISGAGPTAFALVDSEPVAGAVAAVMVAAYAAAGLSATVRIAAIDREGARAW